MSDFQIGAELLFSSLPMIVRLRRTKILDGSMLAATFLLNSPWCVQAVELRHAQEQQHDFGGFTLDELNLFEALTTKSFGVPNWVKDFGAPSKSRNCMPGKERLFHFSRPSYKNHVWKTTTQD